MMKVNIYSEIFNILNEYELLLNIYHDKKFIIDEKNKNQKEKEININKNLNEFMDNDFLNYIFNSVKIKKNDIPDNNLNQTQNNDLNKDKKTYNNELNEAKQTYNNESSEDNESCEDNKKNDNNELNEDKQTYNNESSEDNESCEDNKKNNEVNNFIKKYYRKIVILTHPDKTNDIIKNNIFKKAKDNIENNFLIGIIKNCYDLKIEINDLTESLLNHIMFEIRVIQEKIIELRKIINI
jgi:hypothetical protein